MELCGRSAHSRGRHVATRLRVWGSAGVGCRAADRALAWYIGAILSDIWGGPVLRIYTASIYRARRRARDHVAVGSKYGRPCRYHLHGRLASRTDEGYGAAGVRLLYAVDSRDCHTLS